MVLGYYWQLFTGNFYLLRVDAFNANILHSHVIEGFDVGIHNRDIKPRMFNYYDPLDKAGYVNFAGSWTLFGFAPYRYAVFKLSTSKDILLVETKETRKEITAIEEAQEKEE